MKQKKTLNPNAFSLKIGLRVYLTLHFLLLPLSYISVTYKPSVLEQAQGFAATGSWFLEPNQLRRLSPTQARLAGWLPKLNDLQDRLFFPIFLIFCSSLLFIVRCKKVFLQQQKWQLEGG